MIEIILALLIREISRHLIQYVANDGDVYARLRQIAAELEGMKDFLKHAEEMTARTDAMNEWAGSVRDAAYDVQDLMDEFLHLIHSHHRGGIKGVIHSVPEFFDYIKVYKFADEVEAVIKEIRLISETRQRLFGAIRFEVPNVPNNPQLQREWPGFDEGGIVLGIDGVKNKVIQLLTNHEQQMKVVSVWGMGGLGKTTLARTVYTHPEVNKRFTATAWIHVTRFFNVDDLLRNVIDELLGGATPSNTHHIRQLHQLLKQKRYLIILDDVWTVDGFHKFLKYFPRNDIGSRIIVTTRNRDVANSISIDRSYVLNICPLSEMDARSLLCKTALGDLKCPLELDNCCRVIIDKCKGLPLAIAAIGRMMAGKPATAIAWEHTCRRLEWEMSRNETLEGMTQVLMLSYECLPYELQRCFLYCSLFKEGHLFKTKWLVCMWIAEGYVLRDANNNNMTLEEIGVYYVEQLAARSMIQVHKEDALGRPRLFQIHDIMRNLALQESRGENLCVTTGNQLEDLDKRCRRLSIMESLDVSVLQPIHRLSKIRTLLASSSCGLSFLHTICSSLKNLRVLDLSGAPIDDVPGQVFDLFNLRYLSLRGTGVRKIPSNLEKFYNLQTLDLWKTEVTALPREIVKLRHLRHLYKQDVLAERLHYHNIGGIVRGRDAPSGISDLKDLQTLKTIRASQPALEELSRMTQLRQLGVTNLDADRGEALCESIRKMKELSCLTIRASEGQVLKLNELCSPELHLHKLALDGQLQSAPVWFPSLQSLRHLQLSKSLLAEGEYPLRSLGNLPYLAHLALEDDAYGGKLLYFESDIFRRLETLTLSRLAGLSQLSVQNGGLPRLQVMHLRNLGLRAMEGIEYITRLEELHLIKVTFETPRLPEFDPSLMVFIS